MSLTRYFLRGLLFFAQLFSFFRLKEKGPFLGGVFQNCWNFSRKNKRLFLKLPNILGEKMGQNRVMIGKR